MPDAAHSDSQPKENASGYQTNAEANYKMKMLVANKIPATGMRVGANFEQTFFQRLERAEASRWVVTSPYW